MILSLEHSFGNHVLMISDGLQDMQVSLLSVLKIEMDTYKAKYLEEHIYSIVSSLL